MVKVTVYNMEPSVKEALKYIHVVSNPFILLFLCLVVSLYAIWKRIKPFFVCLLGCVECAIVRGGGGTVLHDSEGMALWPLCCKPPSPPPVSTPHPPPHPLCHQASAVDLRDQTSSPWACESCLWLLSSRWNTLTLSFCSLHVCSSWIWISNVGGISV